MDSKEKKVTPETSECEEKNSFEFIAYLLNYIKVSPIKSLSATVFASGAISLLLFFLKMGYMPEINFESITAILYGVAILGLLFTLYLLVCLILPGLFLFYIKKEIIDVTTGHLICITIAASILAFIAISFFLGIHEVIFSLYFSYFIGGMGIINFILLGMWYSYGDLILINRHQLIIKIKSIYLSPKKIKSRKSNKHLFFKIFGFIAIIILIYLALYILSIPTLLSLACVIIPILPILFFRNDLKQVENKQNSEANTSKQTKIIKNCNKIPGSFRIFMWTAGTTIVFTFLIILSVLLFFHIWANGDSSTETNSSFLLKLGLLIVIPAIGSGFIGTLKNVKQILYSLIPYFYLLISIFILINRLPSIAFLGIKALRIGDINSARITVSKETCQEINHTLGQKVCDSQSHEASSAICPVMITSRIGNQMVLEFSPLEEIKSKKNNESEKNKNYSWITTKGVDKSGISIRITRMVILDKSKILGWQPLARIKEKDFNDIKKTSSEQNTASASSASAPAASEPAANSVDNDTLKLVTLYDAKQKISAGTASDVDEFLLRHCREDTDEFNNKNPAPNK
ncbi:hypothetical protein [Snodgrassella sp. ESL0253]|uniref:hypothetical protein n=1 Tax=Snodgrassella sp. ESL0253 TaxID=2705031 RepID=UPI00158249DD|nr:hypothetical protein [Snodgrassella sp. ESL0253]NUE66453.1 hypothetical protein [Snodgrassella sp. ESL0253]